MDDLNGFAVEEDLFVSGERLGRPGAERFVLHPKQHLLVPDDARRVGRESAIARRIAAEPFAGFGDCFVAAGVIRVRAGVDQDANRFVRHRADGLEDVVAEAAHAGVNEQHAFVADLHGDVRACAYEHVDETLDVHKLDGIGASRIQRRWDPGFKALRHRGRGGRGGRGGILWTSTRRTTSNSGARQLVFVRELGLLRLRSRRPWQQVRDVALRVSRHLVDDVEFGAGDFLRRVDHPVGAADERLLEIDRILHDRHHRQHVAMPHEVFSHRRLVRVRDAVALNPPDLQVRRLDDELVALPAGGGEAGPRVRGIRGRMRTAVEPDEPCRLAERAEQLVADRLLRHRVEDLIDADVRRPAQRVSSGMRLGLVLAQRKDRGVPAVGLHPRGVIDRQAEVIAEFRTGNPVLLILVIPSRPFAGEVHLRRRAACNERRDKDQAESSNWVTG